MKVKNYFKGLAIILLFIILMIFGLLFLRIITFGVELFYGLIFLIILIMALIILPSYLGKKKVIKSKNYPLKKVKKSS